MNFKTEYLIIIEKKEASGFYGLCDTISAFNKVLQDTPGVVIKGDTIRYKGQEYVYEVRKGQVGGKTQRFFFVTIVFDGDAAGIEAYTELLGCIRGIGGNPGVQIETLWNDVSLYYCQEVYPAFHRIENLMRKLITYFMLTNVGTGWASETLPVPVKEAIDKSKSKQDVQPPYRVDFIVLADFLFKPYQTRSVAELYEMLDSAQQAADLDLEALQSFSPKSNWERYFSSFVECEDDYLNKKWRQLYDLRCIVAHNGTLHKAEHDQVLSIIGEVEPHLRKAIENLDKVHVPEEDREQVAESVVGNVNALYGEFVQKWKTLELSVARTTGIVQSRGKSKGLFQKAALGAAMIRLNTLVSDELYQQVRNVQEFRNRLVHDAGVSFSEQEVREKIGALDELIIALKLGWKEELVDALQALGGEANLSEIYDYIRTHTSRKLTENWEAIARYTLQQYSSDTETYKGGVDLFRHVSKGRWALRGKNPGEEK